MFFIYCHVSNVSMPWGSRDWRAPDISINNRRVLKKYELCILLIIPEIVAFYFLIIYAFVHLMIKQKKKTKLFTGGGSEENVAVI